MSEPVRLAPGDPAPDHPFAHPDRSAEDLAVLRSMLARLRAHVTSLGPDAAGARDDHLTDPGGAVNRLVLPSVSRARAAADLVAVGFFGQARAHVDHAPIVDLETALIAAMPGTPGLVTYYNRFVPDEGWGNLVLFGGWAAKDAWGGDPRHAEAVRRSPTHYHSIRLHHAVLPGGIPGAGDLELVRTRYLDLDGSGWRAIRSPSP